MRISKPNKYIPFNVPALTGLELSHIKKAVASKKFSGENDYSKKCAAELENVLGSKKVFLTTSGTHSLEMAALLCNVNQKDEIIMPSYTFTSTATAFALRGAKIKFVDIRPDTMNIDENKIEQAVTKKTKAIVVVHYAGVACNMDKIIRIAKKYDLFLIEDAAQALYATFKGKPLGTFGHLGCFSFHETKNIQCGEGGAISVNWDNHLERSEIIREKGTNRSKFFRGEINKYGWVDIGSSYLLGELNAAFLYGQMMRAEKIIADRTQNWRLYQELLAPLEDAGLIEMPKITKGAKHNAHIFYIKCKDVDERQRLIRHLDTKKIKAVFHYLPLHSSKAGKKYGIFIGEDQYTTKESERILRLPLFYKMTEYQTRYVAEKIINFYESQN